MQITPRCCSRDVGKANKAEMGRFVNCHAGLGRTQQRALPASHGNIVATNGLTDYSLATLRCRPHESMLILVT